VRATGMEHRWVTKVCTVLSRHAATGEEADEVVELGERPATLSELSSCELPERVDRVEPLRREGVQSREEQRGDTQGIPVHWSFDLLQVSGCTGYGRAAGGLPDLACDARSVHSRRF
jgi:hypothetical protein